ncbi:MAG TPA: YciI family protein [Candidatus Paceibacterota bacterium]|nr:YciI family protein [Candidatus Paceibacterota bacterium]
MNQQSPVSEYLVLSRGQWDKGIAKADIQAAIDRFYDWYEQNLREGRMKAGSRLTTDAALVSRSGIVTDGPFNEAKEVVGGYWFIVARSLREAAEIAAQNPCVQCGLSFEIRPLEPRRACADEFANETPGR